MKTSYLLPLLLLCIYSNLHAQENYKPGNPIKGAIIKAGRNPGGDIATQSRKLRTPSTDSYSPWEMDDANTKQKPKTVTKKHPAGVKYEDLKVRLQPPTWIYADAGAILPNADVKKWLGVKDGYQFTLGAAIPFNQRFGISVQGAYSSFSSNNNVPNTAMPIKYMSNGAVNTLGNNPMQKAHMQSFSIMAGPTIFKNLGPKFYIQPSILFGYNHNNYTGMSSGDSARFNGSAMAITQYQTGNQSSGQFVIRPDLKFGILLSPTVALQASVDYTILPKFNFTTTTFQPNGNPNAQGWYEFQQLKGGIYVSKVQSVNPSYIHASLGITIALASKHAIGTKGMGAQTYMKNPGLQPSTSVDVGDINGDGRTDKTKPKENSFKLTPEKQEAGSENVKTVKTDSTIISQQGVEGGHATSDVIVERKNNTNNSSEVVVNPVGDLNGDGKLDKTGNSNPGKTTDSLKKGIPTPQGYAISTKGTGGQIRMKNPNQNKPDSSHAQTSGTDKVTVQDINFGPMPPRNKKNARMIGGNNGKVDVRDLSIMRRIRASHDSTYVPNPNDFTIEVNIQFGMKSQKCKGTGICNVTIVMKDDAVNASQAKYMTMVHNPVEGILIFSIPENVLSQTQPDAIKDLKAKKEFALGETWKASDEINKKLHATTPIIIKKGNYPLTYENGVYYITAWFSKKGYDSWKSTSK